MNWYQSIGEWDWEVVSSPTTMFFISRSLATIRSFDMASALSERQEKERGKEGRGGVAKKRGKGRGW